MSKFIIVFVTCSSKKEATKIARIIVSERLAGCINIINPIKSIYLWKGNVFNSLESLLIIKTTDSLYNKLQKRIKEIHSYKIPEIISIHIKQGDASYLKWLKNCVGSH